jgi:hypothetical protein
VATMRYILTLFFFYSTLFSYDYYPSINQKEDPFGNIGAKKQFEAMHNYQMTERAISLPIVDAVKFTQHADLDEDGKFCSNDWSHKKVYIPKGTTYFKLLFTTGTNTNYLVHMTWRASKTKIINHNHDELDGEQLESVTSENTFYYLVQNVGSVTLDKPEQFEKLFDSNTGGWLYIDIIGATHIWESPYYNDYNAVVGIIASYKILDSNGFNEFLNNTKFKDDLDPIDDVASLTILDNDCYTGPKALQVNLDQDGSTTPIDVIETPKAPKILFDSIHQTPSDTNKKGALEQYTENNTSLDIFDFKQQLSTFSTPNDNAECTQNRYYFKAYIPAGSEKVTLNFNTTNPFMMHFKFGSNFEMDFTQALSIDPLSNLKTNVIFKEVTQEESNITLSGDIFKEIISDGGWLYMTATNYSSENTLMHLNLHVEINGTSEFETWLKSTNFTSDGDPVEEADKGTMLIKDNYCEGGILDSSITLAQNGSSYDADPISDILQQKKDTCKEEGGTWLGTNCDYSDAAPTSSSSKKSYSSTSYSSSPAESVSSSGVPSDILQQKKDTCKEEGGTWLGTNCDYSDSGSDEPDTTIEDIIITDNTEAVSLLKDSKEFTIKGYLINYTDYENAWAYVTPSGQTSAKFDGKDSDGKIKWHIFAKDAASVNSNHEEVSFTASTDDETLANNTYPITYYVIRYKDTKYGWAYSNKDGSIIKRISGLNSNESIIWENLNLNATVDLTKNILTIK